MASDAKPPMPTAAPSASSGAIAERASDPTEDTRAPTVSTEEPAPEAESSTSSMALARPRMAGSARPAACFVWPVA